MNSENAIFATLKPLSLYLHIPFCAVRCTYCAFNTYTHLDALIPAFVDALCQEIAWVGASHHTAHAGQPVHTIFFGGGTPSLLTMAQFSQIMAAIFASFDVLPDAEISLEANPSDMTPEYAIGLAQAGFNRISFGMQSSNARELALFERRHNQDDVVNAVAAARGAGFANLNLDLIYGVPHQTMESWQETVEAALALQPEHLSLYGLVLEEGTAMNAWVENGRLPAPDDDLAADMYEWVSARMAAAGHVQYEISNWALPGYECRHNLQYWRSDDYLGFGPGAHGFARNVRYWNILSPHRYVGLMNDATAPPREYPASPAVDEAHALERDEAIAESLLMGLRLLKEGVGRGEFAARFGVDLFAIHGEMLARHASTGLLTIDDERVRLTERGRLLSNVVLRELV